MKHKLPDEIEEHRCRKSKPQFCILSHLDKYSQRIRSDRQSNSVRSCVSVWRGAPSPCHRTMRSGPRRRLKHHVKRSVCITGNTEITRTRTRNFRIADNTDITQGKRVFRYLSSFLRANRAKRVICPVVVSIELLALSSPFFLALIFQ